MITLSQKLRNDAVHPVPSGLVDLQDNGDGRSRGEAGYRGNTAMLGVCGALEGGLIGLVWAGWAVASGWTITAPVGVHCVVGLCKMLGFGRV